MPPGTAGDGVLDRYRTFLQRVDAAARAVSAPDATSPCGGCRACCGPLSLLSLEAYALLATGLLDGRPPGEGACPLLDEGRCRAGDARPFACRARGLPARHLDADGGWSTEGCGFTGGGGRALEAAAPLAEWAALLFHLDREFRGSLGLPAGRVALDELCRSPGRYRAPLSAAGLPLASRVAT